MLLHHTLLFSWQLLIDDVRQTPFPSMSPPTYSQRKAYAVPPPSSAFFDRLVFYKILACLSGASDMLYNR